MTAGSTGAPTQRVHATCVALRGRGVLLRGPSGAGKSDLALRLIAGAGAMLVADDQTVLTRNDAGVLRASPAPAIAGQIEARGLGRLALAHVEAVPVVLVADLVTGRAPERLPDPGMATLLEVALPRVELDPFAAGAIAKLCLALGVRDGTLLVGPDDGLAPPTAPQAPGPREDAAMMTAGEIDDAPTSRDPKSGEAPAAPAGPLRVVLVTGLSGAGRSTVLKALEDLGYEAIDNLPLNVLPRIVAEGAVTGPLALGVDIRTRSFAAAPFLTALAGLRADPALDVTLLFLDCAEEELRRRFTETRRRHPLAQDRPVTDGIALERRLVAPLREQADLDLDTTGLSVTGLRGVVASRFALAGGPRMAVFVASFAYKNGVPREADLVFDARFLRNPHYDADLRPLTGQDRRVAAYVAEDPDYAPTLADLTRMLARLVPRYAAEGKSYLTIAVGCTGGRHRSVTLAEALGRFLNEAGWHVIVHHRTLDVSYEMRMQSGVREV